MRLVLPVAAGFLALLVPAAGAVTPAPVPADNGTPACADARQGLEQANADVARFQKTLAGFETRLRQAEKALAEARKAPKPNDARLKQAEGNVADAQKDVTRLQKEGKRLQTVIDQLAATAAAQCRAAEPTASDTTGDLTVPADNGTKQCQDARDGMTALLDAIDRLEANEAFKLAGPLGLSDVAQKQIETQKKRLRQQLEALAPAAAKACAVTFTGTWSGTYHEAADTCVPSGKSGPMTMTLTQTGDSLSGTLTDQAYNLACSEVDLHGALTGTVTAATASVQTSYDNGAGSYAATLTLAGKTLTYQEQSGDSATLTRG